MTIFDGFEKFGETLDTISCERIENTQTDVVRLSTHRVEPVLFVVVEDFRNGKHARVLFRLETFHSFVGLVPVQNAAHERTDQRATGFSAGDCILPHKKI